MILNEKESHEKIPGDVESLAVNSENRKNSQKSLKDESKTPEKTRVVKKYQNKYMKKFPELYKSDVSVFPSYTGLKTPPYHILCRRRLQKTRKVITSQLNREIMHMAMIQSYALGSVRIDRNFDLGFPPEATKIPDIATERERRRINLLICNR